MGMFAGLCVITSFALGIWVGTRIKGETHVHHYHNSEPTYIASDVETGHNPVYGDDDYFKLLQKLVKGGEYR